MGTVGTEVARSADRIESAPRVGQRVMFGHLMLDGERTGTITETWKFGSRWECRVAVDFTEADNPAKNPPGKVVGGCLFFDTKEAMRGGIPASNWQYCYPLVTEQLALHERHRI